jgi:hypothetical protein
LGLNGRGSVLLDCEAPSVTVAHPTAHSVKRLSGSCASLAAMLKCIRPKPRYAVGQLLRSIPSTRNLGTPGLSFPAYNDHPTRAYPVCPWTFTLEQGAIGIETNFSRCPYRYLVSPAGLAVRPADRPADPAPAVLRVIFSEDQFALFGITRYGAAGRSAGLAFVACGVGSTGIGSATDMRLLPTMRSISRST